MHYRVAFKLEKNKSLHLRTKGSQVVITFATQTKKQRPLRLWVQTNFDYCPIVLSDVFLLKKRKITKWYI